MDLNLEEQLAIAKNLDHIEKNGRPVQQKPNNTYLTGDVDNINEMVYGKSYIPTNQEQNVYSADEDLKRIQQGLPKDLSNCKLPKTILESIKANPLNGLTVDPKMDSFTEKLSKSMPNGLQKTLELQKQLEDHDRKNTINEQRATLQANTSNGDLKTLIKEAVIEVLGEMNLNESVNRPSIKAMKLLGDKFLFLDSQDNIYECNLTYKGKNKKKK